MKILILSVRDTGGTAYTLAHAINKIKPEHQCVNVRGSNNYINYPTIADMSDYSRTKVREMVYKADVLVFLGAMRPFFEALKLAKGKLKDKKKILYETGSEWRWGREQLIKQADDLLSNYKIMLGGSDMFLPYPEGTPPVSDDVEFLPITRSFSEIRHRYGLCNQDEAALGSFDVPKKTVYFAHAPTSEQMKGSHIFYKVATRAMQMDKNIRFTTIRQQPWASCLYMLAHSQVLYDQAPPFPTAYGAISVEASIFKLPVFSQVDPRAREWLKKKTGLDTPFIVFTDEEDLLKKTYSLATQPELRKVFGNACYKYCKALHDERPVVERFFKIVEGMN